MGPKGKSNVAELDETTVEEEDLATHQETIPLPLFSGTQVFAARWISPAISILAVQAPETVPAKK